MPSRRSTSTSSGRSRNSTFIGKAGYRRPRRYPAAISSPNGCHPINRDGRMALAALATTPQRRAISNTDPDIGPAGDDLSDALVDQRSDGCIGHGSTGDGPRIPSAQVPGRVTSTRGVTSRAATTIQRSLLWLRPARAVRVRPQGPRPPGRRSSPATDAVRSGSWRGGDDAVGAHTPPDFRRSVPASRHHRPVRTPGDEGANGDAQHLDQEDPALGARHQHLE